MVDDLLAEVEELKKREASSTITKVEARVTKLNCQLEDVERCLVTLAKQQKEVRGHNRAMEDKLLWLT